MTPTMELRFVERTIKTPYGNDGAEVSKIVRILQQKWCASTTIQGVLNPYKYEWRDVPLVKEEA